MVIQIKSKLPSEEISIFSRIAVLSKEHQAINLGQGYPDFEVSSELKNRVSHYLSADKDQYAPMQGILPLRQVLCKKYEAAYQSPLDPASNICITAGATEAIFTCIQAAVHTGDEVIIIEPSYDSYSPSIKIAGGIPIPILLKKDFSIDWEKVGRSVTDKTRMIIVNNPHNPTGQVWKEEDFLALSQIVKNTDILILSDEVYEHIVFDDQSHQSIISYPELFKRSFATFSFGKTFHATGWKMGYVIAPDVLMKAFYNVHQWNVFSVNSFLQYALTDHLRDASNYMELGRFYQEKRDYFISLMEETAFEPLPSYGSYFQLYDYSKISDLKDLAFSEWLIKEHGIATIPISPFCSTETPWKVVRFCFAKRKETLAKAVKRLQLV